MYFFIGVLQMPYSINKYNPRTFIGLFAAWQGAFTDEEIDQIRWKGDVGKFQAGTTGNATVADENIRKSSVSWIPGNESNRWIYQKIAGVVGTVNHERFMYNIDELSDLQYTRYDEGGDHYSWHYDTETDKFSYRERKISMIMALNNPDEYEGGDFQICSSGNLNQIDTYRPKKGEMIFFCSMFPHRVTPVTKGRRETLVAWISGVRDGMGAK